MTGKIILTIILSVLAVLLLRGLREPRMLRVTRKIIGSGSKHLRVLLISDIHAQFYYLRSNLFESVINTEDLGAVLFAGDLTNGRHDLVKGLHILEEIAAMAAARGIPTYAVSGNHDVPEIGRCLQEIGVRYLSNQTEWFLSPDGSLWRIAGLEDYRTGTSSYRQAYMDVRDPFPGISAGSPLPEVVLAHNPESLFGIVKDRRELSGTTELSRDIFLLSGHFHGGQIWMPFGIEYSIMRSETMCKQGFRKGYYEKDGIKGYISRGLGCVLIPLRFLSVPEAAILELQAE